MLKDPIFIMSSERSGSNLLRVMIGNHSNIASPIPTQLLAGFSNASRYYYPLQNRDNALALFQKINHAVNLEYQNWKISPNFEDFYSNAKAYCFLDFLDFFYAEKAKEEIGKKRIVFKENAIFDYAFQLKHYYPGAKFIYLFRDPRDYVASWMSVPLGYETPDEAAHGWALEQKKCDILINVFGLPVYNVKYEELITDPKKVMTGLLNFIGEPVEEGCFVTDKNKNKELAWNEYWKNLEKPVLKDNYGKYRKALDEQTIRLVEDICKEGMIKLNYQPDYNFEPFHLNKSFLTKIISKVGRKKHNAKMKAGADHTSKLLGERQSFTRTIQKDAYKFFEKNHLKSRL